MAAVGDAEVDPARLEIVGEPEQVLGGVDDVVRDPERAADDVGRAAGQDGDRDVGSREPVRDLVQGAVAAEGDDEVIAAVARLAADLGRVVLGLRSRPPRRRSGPGARRRRGSSAGPRPSSRTG